MKLNAFLLILFITFVVPIAAQQNVSPQSTEDLQKRVTEMESEMKAMREELVKLKQSLPKTQLTTGSNYSTVTQSEVKAETKTETKIETKTEAKTSPNAEANKQPKQTSVDNGSVRLTPYDTIYFNAFSNTGGTNNADVPLFATPTGAGNTSASVRQTRFGLRLEGARVGNANLRAVLEADFFGGFPAIGIGENFGVVRLRLANARLDWEKTSVIVGQDWMVFAPVNPISLAAAAIPQMTAAGNNWARLPQIKVERKLNKNFMLAGAVLAPQTGDAPTNAAFFLQPTSGASSRVPFFQSRIAFADANFFGTKKSGSIGLSGHYGRSRVFTGAAANVKNNIESSGVALDWNIPLAGVLSFSGEAFAGRDLAGFQAGVFQNHNIDFAYRTGNTLVAGGVRSIGTRGGWAQLGLTPTVLQNRLSFYGSIGLDDPRKEDLISRTPRDFRTRNLALAFDVIYKLNPQFQIGGEFRRLQTDYLLSGERKANHVNLGAAYSF
jgi:hypothetical protein